MSKTYKGWEILKMTEEGRFKERDVVSGYVTDYTLINGIWTDINDRSINVGLSEFIKVDFTVPVKLVSFAETFNNNKGCWVEHVYISKVVHSSSRVNELVKNLIDKQPQSIKNVLHALSCICNNNEIFIDIIKHGKWYIEN